jgi:hypothetical protein
MSLPTDWVVGDPGHAAAHNTLDTQVNTNTGAIAILTASIAGKLDAANNLSDVADVTTSLANLGLAQVVTVESSGVNTRLWVQTTDPDTTDPGVAADGDLWFFPAAS